MKIGVLAHRESAASEIVALLPAGHSVRRLALGRDGFETSTAYACDLVIISLAGISLDRAVIMCKRMREVAMRVILTGVPIDIDAGDLVRHADLVVIGNSVNTWRHVICASKWDALPRVIRDGDFRDHDNDNKIDSALNA